MDHSTPARPNAIATAGTLSQVVQSTATLAFTHGLNPAQWAALRYFAHTAPETSGVMGFARHHGTTKGTASQTIAALEKKGFVARHRNQDDRRAFHLHLTAAGHNVLADDPLRELATAITALPNEQHIVMAEALERMLRLLLARRVARSQAPPRAASESPPSPQRGKTRT